MNKIFLTKTIKGNTITIDVCFNIIKNGLSDLFYCYNNIEIPKSSEFTLNEIILLLADLNNDVDENTYNDIHSFVLSHIKENEINSSINKTMDETYKHVITHELGHYIYYIKDAHAEDFENICWE